MSVVLFQGSWLGAVGGAGAGLFWLGPAAALVAVATHLAVVERPVRELGAILAVATLGTSWDGLSATLGLVEYRGGLAALGGVPLWIVALWLAFSTTLNASLTWLRTRPLWAAGLGAIGGPLSYLAAEGLGAVTLVVPTTSLLAQGLGWALLLPACLYVAGRLDGTVPLVAERARV